MALASTRSFPLSFWEASRSPGGIWYFLFLFRPLAGPGGIGEVDVDERFTRAYLYWTPHARVATTLEYLFERSDSTDITAPFGPKITTHRVPLGLNFYHPWGFFTKLKGTYVDQKGLFQVIVPPF